MLSDPRSCRRVRRQTLGRTSWNAELVRDPDELVEIDLDADQRAVLKRGLAEWGGPAVATDVLAVAMGFASAVDLAVQRRRLLAALDTHQPMSRWDWTRMLLATEIVFASDVLGSGAEWPTTTGLDDVETLKILRGLQRKLGPARVPVRPERLTRP